MSIRTPKHNWVLEDAMRCTRLLPLVFFALTASSLPQSSGLNFTPAAVYGSGGSIAQSVAVADVNGDGKPDLLVANCGIGCGGSGKGTVGVLLGNGDGTFQTAVTYGSGGLQPLAVAVADVTGMASPILLWRTRWPTSVPATTVRTAVWAYSWGTATEHSKRR
jgi:hypothetical protein